MSQLGKRHAAKISKMLARRVQGNPPEIHYKFLYVTSEKEWVAGNRIAWSTEYERIVWDWEESCEEQREREEDVAESQEQYELADLFDRGYLDDFRTTPLGAIVLQLKLTDRHRLWAKRVFGTRGFEGDGVLGALDLRSSDFDDAIYRARCVLNVIVKLLGRKPRYVGVWGSYLGNIPADVLSGKVQARTADMPADRPRILTTGGQDYPVEFVETFHVMPILWCNELLPVAPQLLATIERLAQIRQLHEYGPELFGNGEIEQLSTMRSWKSVPLGGANHMYSSLYFVTFQSAKKLKEWRQKSRVST